MLQTVKEAREIPPVGMCPTNHGHRVVFVQCNHAIFNEPAGPYATIRNLMVSLLASSTWA